MEQQTRRRRTSGGIRSLGFGLLFALATAVGCAGDNGGNPGAGGSTAGGAGGTSAGTGGAAGNGGAPVGQSGASGEAGAGMNGGGSGGAAGVAGAGVAGVGAAGAGAAGASGGGAAPVGEHCDANLVLNWPEEVFDSFGGPLSTCADYPTSAAGVPDSPVILVTNIALPEAMSPGNPYAFSILIGDAPEDGSVTIEFWGSDAQCGFGAEQLYSGVMLPGILCVDLQATAAHEHLLMVWRGPGSLTATDVAICPGGSCP